MLYTLNLGPVSNGDNASVLDASSGDWSPKHLLKTVRKSHTTYVEEDINQIFAGLNLIFWIFFRKVKNSRTV